jgi:hypothetical protein
MEFIIDLWVSIPNNYRIKIIWVISFVIPVIVVISFQSKWTAIVIGTMTCIIPGELNYYALCYKQLALCNSESYELLPIMIGLLLSFIYCLFVKFLYLSIRTLFKE